jgi:hypothetical protein
MQTTAADSINKLISAAAAVPERLLSIATSQLTGRWHGCQAIFFMVFHASMALSRSIRLRVCGTG